MTHFMGHTARVLLGPLPLFYRVKCADNVLIMHAGPCIFLHAQTPELRIQVFWSDPDPV